MGEEEAEGVFRKILQRHRDFQLMAEMFGVCGTSSGWFADESSYLKTDGRLFGGAFPDLAERLALEVLNDPEGPQPDRLYAWFILSVLAPWTNAALEDFLTEQVKTLPAEREEERNLAIVNLIRRRFDDRTLALCRAEARKGGNRAAIEVLTTVVDAEAIRLFQEMTRWDMNLPYPLEGMPITAERMLERIAILQSKDWDKLGKILMGWKSDKFFYLHVPWALEAAERQAMPGLREILEKRLLQIRKNPGTADLDYDWLLVAWMNLGGALTAKEEHRLTFYGFLGDYERRLQEVLATRRDYRR